MQTQKNTTLVGLGGSKILVSQGAEEFDPDSLLDSAISEEVSLLPISRSVDRPVVILTLSPPIGEDVQVAGILEALVMTRTAMVVEFVCLVPVALELSYLLFGIEPVSLVTYEFRHGSDEPTTLDVSGFKLEKVELRQFYENNKVKVELLMSRYSE